MKLEEINLFGVYVAPLSVMIVAAWIMTLSLRWVADRFGLLRYVWNPPLFVCGVYVMVLATIVLCCAN
jgi:protein AaeX